MVIFSSWVENSNYVKRIHMLQKIYKLMHLQLQTAYICLRLKIAK